MEYGQKWCGQATSRLPDPEFLRRFSRLSLSSLQTKCRWFSAVLWVRKMLEPLNRRKPGSLNLHLEGRLPNIQSDNNVRKRYFIVLKYWVSEVVCHRSQPTLPSKASCLTSLSLSFLICIIFHRVLTMIKIYNMSTYIYILCWFSFHFILCSQSDTVRTGPLNTCRGPYLTLFDEYMCRVQYEPCPLELCSSAKLHKVEEKANFHLKYP